MVSDLTDKDSAFYKTNLAKLNKKIQLQEEITWLKNIERDKGWKVTEWILLLSTELLKVEEEEVDTATIFEHDRETEDEYLLEIVLANMRQETQYFQKNLQREKKDTRKELITKINELGSYINADGFYKESKEKEG